MIKKEEVIAFFDQCAPWWDSDMIRHEDILSTILTLGGIRADMEILDVACGTGVLFPDYLSRGVRHITGIDISPEMAKLAASKFPQAQVICGDVMTWDFPSQFDAVMVYNAFPHFPDPAGLIQVLAQHTKPGGRLSVAHSMSRQALIKHHERASAVSIDLLHEQELAQLFAPWFDVDVVISTDRMYQVSGVRRSDSAQVLPVEQDPDRETVALLKYMVSHNDAHAQELAALADQLQAGDHPRLSRQLMEAVAGFDVANAQLSAVLKSLTRDA